VKAYELLEQRELCKGHLAEGENHSALPLNAEVLGVTTLKSYDCIGAIFATQTDAEEAMRLILRVVARLKKLGIELWVSDWNDRPERTKEDVVALLKELDI
jgi:hypothetical protein